MLIIGLMVIALICLAVGLVLPSSAWLIASLIATAGAGYLVWKMRSAIAPAGSAAGLAAGTSSPPADGVGVSDHGSAVADESEAASDSAGPAAAASTADTTVITAVPAEDATQLFAAVPAEDATQVLPAVPGDAANAADHGDVWVIDGRPRYHLGNCPIIQGQDAEPIPFDQAVEDGFMPCSLCEPSMARTGR